MDTLGGVGQQRLGAKLHVPQTWLGVQTFADGTFKLAGATSGVTTLKASAAAGGTHTFPLANMTVAGLELAQTFSIGAKTFNSGMLRLAGSSSGFVLLQPQAASSTTTFSFPNAGGADTLAILGTAQTFTAAQTLATNVKFLLRDATNFLHSDAADSVLLQAAAALSLQGTVNTNVGTVAGNTTIGVSGGTITIADHVSVTDGKNFAFASGGTGHYIGTAANQVLAFWGGTRGQQPANTTDVLAALITVGLRASGGAPPLNLGTASTAVLTCYSAALTSKVTTYNNVTTAGWGVPAIQATGRVVAKTNVASGTITTYTCGAADGSFQISANVLVTTSTTHSFSVTCTYTDEGNTARTFTFGFTQLSGATLLTLITNVTGVGPYESPVYQIRVKASTAITIQTSAATFTGVVYNAEGLIVQTA